MNALAVNTKTHAQKSAPTIPDHTQACNKYECAGIVPDMISSRVIPNASLYPMSNSASRSALRYVQSLAHEPCPRMGES